MHCVRLTHYPNNELRASSYPLPGRRRFVFEDESHESHGETEVSPTPEPSPDILSLAPNSELSAKPGFGGTPRQTRFGLNGRRTILRAGGAIDKSGIPPEQCVFLTGTLPGSTNESMAAIAQWSAYIIDRLKSWLSKFAQDRLEFYVWELQARGALHLHYCAVIPSPDARSQVLARFKKQWIKLLSNVAEKSGVDVFERADGKTWKGCYDVIRADAQECKKSVAAYMSKYCSKSSRDRVSPVHCPTRWWSISRPLSKLLQGLTTEIEYICTNHLSARKKEEEVYSFIEQNSQKHYTYKDKSGLCSVVTAYHLPSDFAAISAYLKEEESMRISHISRNGDCCEVPHLMNLLRTLVRETKDSDPSTRVKRQSLIDLVLSGDGVQWDDCSLHALYEVVEPLRFLDDQIHKEYFKLAAPALNVRRVSWIACQIVHELARLYQQSSGHTIWERHLKYLTTEPELATLVQASEQLKLLPSG